MYASRVCVRFVIDQQKHKEKKHRTEKKSGIYDSGSSIRSRPISSKSSSAATVSPINMHTAPAAATQT